MSITGGLAVGLAVALAVAGCAAPPRDGWLVTVYYTAVAAFHDGPAERVTGCPRLECAPGDPDSRTDLGSHPAAFVRAVRDEGTGRTTDGRYLNWSVDTGYWLDTAPRDSAGDALRPWDTAAADADVLPPGSRLRITRCGDDGSGGAIDADVCARLRQARWTVRDEFTPGLGGERHLDVYIGEETGPGFTQSDWYVTLHGAGLTVE